MAWIEFKGVRSSDLGMIVEKMPSKVRARKRVTKHPVLGRDGTLNANGGAYEAISLSVTLNAFGSATEAEIANWLDGKGDLILSDDPTVYYKATAYADVRMQRYRTAEGRNYDSVMVTFECDPYRYRVGEQILEAINGDFIPNDGSGEAKPIITVYGSGSVNLMVGLSTVLIDNLSGSLTLDCDAKTAMTGGTWQGGNVRIVGGWPVLKVGQTAISWTGGATKVTVEPRVRWL